MNTLTVATVPTTFYHVTFRRRMKVDPDGLWVREWHGYEFRCKDSAIEARTVGESRWHALNELRLNREPDDELTEAWKALKANPGPGQHS